MVKERGSYQTKQQEAILALFQAEPNLCLTAEEVHLRLLALGLDVGKTTVYRGVTRLCEAGKLRKYTSHEKGEAAAYEWNNCGENHLHIRCTACGALVHLHCDEVAEFCRHIANHHGFILSESQTILYGRCKECGQTGEGAGA